MKIDYTYFLTWFLLFMIIQYTLLVIEWSKYLDMYTDIQQYKFNFYKNDKNEFVLIRIFLFIVGYLGLLVIIYYYIIKDKKSIFDGSLLVTIMYAMWDCCLYFFFDRAVKHLPVLLFDTIVLGGVNMAISQYILYNYYNTLKKYIPLLFIGYLGSMLWFFYACYQYNPDIWNTKRVVWA